MIKYVFHIPIYECDVMLMQIESKQDSDIVMKNLDWLKVDNEDKQDYKAKIERGCVNGGDCWRNYSLHKFLISFFPFTNMNKKKEVDSHEKRHLEDRILEFVEVNDIEAAGYLSGFLGKKFYKFEQLQNNK